MRVDQPLLGPMRIRCIKQASKCLYGYISPKQFSLTDNATCCWIGASTLVKTGEEEEEGDTLRSIVIATRDTLLLLLLLLLHSS